MSMKPRKFGSTLPPRRCRCSAGARSTVAPARHTPRKRGIQYAAASRFNRTVSGILDHPLSRMMTAVGLAAASPSLPDQLQPLVLAQDLYAVLLGFREF